MIQESFSQQPLPNIAPSYLYEQYADDPNLQAFVDAYNNITQNYLDWFNNTPLSVYTSPYISGALLDWVGQGVYGYYRPSFVIPPVKGIPRGGYGFSIYGQETFAKLRYINSQSGSSSFVNDDIYKRALTWHTYLGDGRQMTITWLKRRIARFLYGANGTDLDGIDNLQDVSILFDTETTYIGPYATAAFATIPYATIRESSRFSNVVKITIANTPASQAFKSLFDNGFLAKPFQLNFQVVILL